MKRDLPIFDIVLKDDDLKQGVGMISLVDDPAIGVNWIKLRKESLVDIEMSFTLTEKGICLGCPPTGDGTRKDGSPDKRCGDGVRKTSSKKPKEPKKEEPKKEDIKKEASRRMRERSFEEPATAEDIKNTGSYKDKNEKELVDLSNRLYKKDVDKKIKKEYGQRAEQDISSGWTGPERDKFDKTWDYDKGRPTEAPKGKVRGIKNLGKDREGDTIIQIDWIDK
jgi:hypothetical protein